MANPLALVTGASSGIGFNLAKVFGENGFDLILVSHGERLENATAELSSLGVEVLPIHADLASYDGVMDLWNQVQSAGRPLDAAAINAGIGVGGLFAETDLEQEINLVRVNVEGTMHLAKHVVKQMVARGEGRILITASIVSEMVAPREAVYGASKAFDLSLAKSLHSELEGTGVSVTALQPGPVDTDFFHRAGMDNTDVGTEGKKKNEPYDVAQQGFKALMAGEKHVYAANLATKIEGALASVTPDSVHAAMHEKMARPLAEK